MQQESDGKEEMWAGKVVLLARCLLKEESEGDKLTFVWYMEFASPLNETNEALRYA